MLSNNDDLINISLKLQIMKVILGDLCLSSSPLQTGSPDNLLAVNKQGALKAAIPGAAIKPPRGAILVCSSSLCIQNQLRLFVSFATNDYVHKYAKICFLWAKPSTVTTGQVGKSGVQIPKWTAGSRCVRRGGCGTGQVLPVSSPVAVQRAWCDMQIYPSAFWNLF